MSGPGQVSPEAEALAGARAAPKLEARYGGVLRDSAAEGRMQRIGRRLCVGSNELEGEYRYRLLDSEEVNAFSLPGGRVYITRGLLERLDEDDMLAAVMAHEMAHIVAKDHLKPRCGNVAEALERETNADKRAVTFLLAAGMSPEAMIHVIRAIEDVLPLGWSNSRIAAVAEIIDDARNATTLAAAA